MKWAAQTCAPPCCREDWLFWPHCWCWRREVGGGHSTSCWGGLSRTRCPDRTGQSPGHSSPASSPAQWDLKQGNISVWGWVWLIRLLWRVNIPLLGQWQCLWEISPQWRRTVHSLRRGQRTLQQNDSQHSSVNLPLLSYRDGSGDCAQKMLTNWRWWCSLEILILASVYSSFPNTVPPTYNRDL